MDIIEVNYKRSKKCRTIMDQIEEYHVCLPADFEAMKERVKKKCYDEMFANGEIAPDEKNPA